MENTTTFAEALIKVAEGYLTLFHEVIFSSRMSHRENNPHLRSVLETSKRRIGIFADCVPSYQRIRRRWVVKPLSWRKLQDHPLPAAFCYNPLGFGGERFDGAYFINSGRLLPILGAQAALVLLEQDAHEDTRSVFTTLGETLVAIMVHEVRHEAQIFEKVCLRNLSHLRARYPDIAHEAVEAQWQEEKAPFYSAQGGDNYEMEEDAYVTEIAARHIWTTVASKEARLAQVRELVIA